ncbi:zinc finger and BTB domain-containing protein 17-like [Thrips palmi]|uniref:Zinc finger and BTB domain-containing protein 17-like n=1 Tax=Thrips palmi TaxID=161013 RepID=A0A6P9AEP4_THRPL|nr:zinc finger and BTB domain-containing protein 17-like [Thrips palmi]
MRAACVKEVQVLGWCTFTGCVTAFDSWNAYVDHFKTRHRPLACSACLEEHSEPHGEADRKCTMCPARFLDRVRLHVHRCLFHHDVGSPSPPQPRWKEGEGVVGWCPIAQCGQPFSSWDEQVAHQRTTHFKATEQCPLCLDEDPVGGLPAHLQAHQLGDAACSVCSARVLGDVDRHLRLYHDVASAPVLGWCAASHCDSAFGSWGDHLQHLQRRHWKSIHPARVCHLCLRILDDAEQTATHLEDHSRQTQYKCKWCWAQFFNAESRKDHMKFFHRR